MRRSISMMSVLMPTLVLIAAHVSAAPSPASSPLPSLVLEAVVSEGLEHPLYLTETPDESGRLFVLEQPGRIRIIKNGTLLRRPFLDIAQRVRSSGGEQGLLGLAFHPNYRKNGRYMVYYTRVPYGATVIAEYRASDDPNVSEMSEKILVAIPHPYANHNGGMVEFGPDGLLYIGTGDGGSGGDPGNRAQNLHELLGKMLRIDVDHGAPYVVPTDNPFVSGGGRPEVFAYGLRNPWRFSFDRESKDLWVADVGQNDWEEVDVVRRGGNYGWRLMEGNHCFLPRKGCATDGLERPVAEYPTRSPRCSITGGYVYRGTRIPALRGVYVHGDYCSGEIFGLPSSRREAIGAPQVLLRTEFNISSFGQDQSGELYVIDHGGAVYRLVTRGGIAARFFRRVRSAFNRLLKNENPPVDREVITPVPSSAR